MRIQRKQLDQSCWYYLLRTLPRPGDTRTPPTSSLRRRYSSIGGRRQIRKERRRATAAQRSNPRRRGHSPARTCPSTAPCPSPQGTFDGAREGGRGFTDCHRAGQGGSDHVTTPPSSLPHARPSSLPLISAPLPPTPQTHTLPLARILTLRKEVALQGLNDLFCFPPFFPRPQSLIFPPLFS